MPHHRACLLQARRRPRGAGQAGVWQGERRPRQGCCGQVRDHGYAYVSGFRGWGAFAGAGGEEGRGGERGDGQGCGCGAVEECGAGAGEEGVGLVGPNGGK